MEIRSGQIDLKIVVNRFPTGFLIINL